MIKLSRILSAYMIRHFLWSLISVLLVIMGLVLLFDAIEILRETASKNIGFALVLEMAVLKLPQMLHTILPFAVMIAAMITFWRLTKSSELVIIRAAGVSVWEFLLPVMVVALLAGVVEVAVFNPVSAAMYKRYEHHLDRLVMRHSSPLVLTEHGLWLRETKDDISVVVHARDVRQEKLSLFMRNLSVLEVKNEHEPVRRIEANNASLKDHYFELEDVWIMHPGEPSEYLEKYNLPTSLTLGKIQENFASPKTLSFWELPAFIQFFESAGFSAHKHRLHWHSLIVSPFMLCAMILVAAIFALRPNVRQGRAVLRITSGIGAGFLLYFFSRVTYALGLSDTLPLILAAWSPAIVAGLISVSVLLHLEDG